MLELKEFTLDLKERYEELLGGIPTSFYQFNNIFMAQEKAGLKYVEINGAFCVVAIPEAGDHSYGFFPLGAEESKLRNAFRVLREELGITRYYVPGEVLPQIETECPGMFGITVSRGDFDYIYDTQMLIQLAGKKYHQKRNHISRFMNTYQYEYLTIDGSNFEVCRPMMDAWFAARTDVNSEVFDEVQVINTLIDNFEVLGLRACALKADGKICAFAIGDVIGGDTAHIIIEKADTAYHGAYSVINQQFLEHAFADTKYVNREEDMDHEGLRKAKASYRPIRFNEVFRLDYLDGETISE